MASSSDRRRRRKLLAVASLLLAPLAAEALPPGLTLIAPGGATVAVRELLRGREATVLVFWSAGCPCVRRYQARADALLAAWPAARVQVLGVLSNAGEAPDAARAEAARRGVRLPLWQDPGGRLAAAVGARSTPTAVVLDGDGAVRFLGWIDNERTPGEAGREAWLEEAVAALLAGDTAPRRRRTFGCPITRGLSSEPRPPCCKVPEP